MKTDTRSRIKQTFLQLLDEKPIGRITVKEVVESCGINRNTFYYYFQDLQALAEAVAEEDFLSVPEESLTLLTVEDALDLIISHTLEHRQAALHIYHSANRERFELSIWRISQYVDNLFLDTLLKGRTIRPEDRLFLQNYQSSAFFGAAMGWLKQGLDPAVRKDVHRLCLLLQEHLEQVLDEMEQAAKENN